MLVITIEGDEFFNEETQEFSRVGDIILELEHSLVSLSKWESKHMIPFLGPAEKTSQQLIDYVGCMIITPEYPQNWYSLINQKNLDAIQDYIDSPQTATTFVERASKVPGRTKEIITSELVYYWMTMFNIPIECEVWHLNRLFALIRIANVKQSKDKKMPKQTIARQNRELNAKRREQMGTKG